MNKEKEKIKILKYLVNGLVKTRLDIYREFNLDWDVLSGLLFELKEDELITNTYDGFAHWEIISKGIDAIKKWDLDGTPGKLFEEVKG